MRLYKNILTLLAVTLFAITIQAQQLTDPLLVEITHPSNLAGTYTYGHQADWGPTTLPVSITGQVEWAYDITPDSIACDPIPAGSLTGKVAMVRRGDCNFTQKVQNAQDAGAIACIVCNNLAGAGPIPMGGGPAASVTILAVMLGTSDCALIDAALAAGDSVSITFRKPAVSGPVISFEYERPQAQAEIIDTMYINLTNIGATTETNVNAIIDIIDPNGIVTTAVGTVPSIAAGATASASVGTLYTPTDKGLYTVICKNALSATDSVVQYFQIGDYTHTLDNQGNHGDAYTWIGLQDAAFATANYRFDMGNVYRIVNTAAATHATFSIDNTSAYFGENFSIFLYQFPATFTGQEVDYSTFTLLGIATHTIDETDTLSNTAMITKALLDVNTFEDSVVLTGGDHYMLVVSYSGSGSVTTSPRFNYSGDAPFLDLGYSVFTTQLYMGGFQDNDSRPVIRLHMNGFISGQTATTPTFIEPKTFDIFPNPVSDVVNVAISLEEMAQDLSVNLIDINGRILETQQFSTTQQQNIQFNTAELPAGFYFVRIQTENGVRVKEFVKK